MMSAWSMSKSLRCRPSEVYGIQSPLAAYCFDSAVTRWGSALEADLQAAGDGEKDGKKAQRARERVLRRYVPSTARYRDPAKE
jgi:hypothetical protein